ncbi:SWI5 [Candida jiufengensis]|uniref:SWI5 n=1 Tax=Candida jiufengensis TaxID=497108 RepID=UPI0022250E5A|nr:SWI5 [Candida jiufengensis]KAI5954412.1 SWI5 [Candida jiufengensis]
MENIFEELKVNESTFDQFFVPDNNEIDFLFNETLNNLQELDVPSGFGTNTTTNNPFHHSYQKSKSKTHSRQMSGTAIFGFTDHNREFSLNGIDFLKQQSTTQSISPGEIIKPIIKPSIPSQDILNFNFESEPLLEEDEEDLTFNKLTQSSPIKQISTPTKLPQQNSQTQPRTIKQDEYIVTNQNPKSYKFPPSPTPFRNDQKIINSYSAKYLQSLQMQQPNKFVDDFEPLLEDPSIIQSHGIIEQPPPQLQSSPIQYQQSQPHSQSPMHIQQQQPPPPPPPSQIQQPLTFNTFLPPPTPPTLSNESPEWQSSPEPLSPSPQRSQLHHHQPQNISPLHPQLKQDINFYTPFYNQQSEYLQQLLSSPYSTNLESPIKDQSPSQQQQQVQQQFSTPTKPKQILEWSPVISPNSKQSLSKQIKDSTPKRRVKKTSLLPPGELDNYWIGPDENKIYKCTYKNCGKLFTRRYNVRSHIQTHLSDRPFSCKFCVKKFVRQHDLNRHLKGHNEARLSKCPCGKEFARLDALKKHQERNICVGGIKGLVNKPSKKKLVDLDPLTQLKIVSELEPI